MSNEIPTEHNMKRAARVGAVGTLATFAALSFAGHADRPSGNIEIHPLTATPWADCREEPVASYQTPAPTVEICERTLEFTEVKDQMNTVLAKMINSKSATYRRTGMKFLTFLEDGKAFYMDPRDSNGINTTKFDVRLFGGLTGEKASDFRIGIPTPSIAETKIGEETYSSFIGMNEGTLKLPTDFELAQRIAFAVTYEQNLSNFYEKSGTRGIGELDLARIKEQSHKDLFRSFIRNK